MNSLQKNLHFTRFFADSLVHFSIKFVPDDIKHTIRSFQYSIKFALTKNCKRPVRGYSMYSFTNTGRPRGFWLRQAPSLVKIYKDEGKYVSMTLHMHVNFHTKNEDLETRKNAGLPYPFFT